jgi:CrcB protein
MHGTFAGQLLLVGMGGFIGSSLRYALSIGVQRLAPTSFFPYGTMTVNVMGCFCIGLLAGLIESRQSLDPGLVLFLMVGVLGGFTTFSAYALESLVLAESGMLLKALANTALQVVVGLFAAWVGLLITR